MVDSEDEWKIKKGRKPDLFCYCHPSLSSQPVIPACHPGLVPGSPYTVPSAEHILTFL